jgi:hypothetical protein
MWELAALVLASPFAPLTVFLAIFLCHLLPAKPSKSRPPIIAMQPLHLVVIGSTRPTDLGRESRVGHRRVGRSVS